MTSTARCRRGNTEFGVLTDSEQLTALKPGSGPVSRALILPITKLNTEPTDR